MAIIKLFSINANYFQNQQLTMPKVLVIYLNVVIAGVLGPGVGCPHRFAVYWSFLQWNFPFVSKRTKKKAQEIFEMLLSIAYPKA